MKNLINLIFFSILATTISAQTQSNCETSWGLEYYYKRDVADLALNRLFSIKSPDTNQIIIQQIHQDSIWKGLTAIYNASSIPERDSVFDFYCIHNNSSNTRKLFQTIYLEVDTSLSWTDNWFNGEIVTGYSELDSLISKYAYNIESVNYNYGVVQIYSEMLINPYAISDSLMSFEGIENALPVPTNFDGNRIEYTLEGEHQYFSFTLAWGDCYMGCINKYKWNFSVNISSCEVEYLGLEPLIYDELPDPLFCNITPIKESSIPPDEAISIFPNPSSDYVCISGNDMQQIELWNEYGQLIQKNVQAVDFLLINMKNYKPGIYFIKVKRENNMRIIKLIHY